MARRPQSPGSRSLRHRPELPLVERRAEIDSLAAILDAVRGGTGAAVIIEAAAGLGKSRLLAEACKLAAQRELRVWRARAVQSERDLPFGVTLRLIEPHLASLGPTERESLLRGAAAPTRAVFDGTADASQQAGAPSPFSALHGLYWLTANIAESGPVLLCVDDAQWCDDPTLRFLRYLCDRIDDLPIAVFGAARPQRRMTDPPPLTALRGAERVTTMPLAPLGPDGVRDVVSAIAPDGAAGLGAACFEATGGNPFYLSELLLALGNAEFGQAPFDPERIRDLGRQSLIRASVFRLVRSGQTGVALAEALAILGERTPLARAAALAGLALDVAAAAADDLAAEELISSGPALDFAHPLIRQAIYEEIPPAKRALAHAEAARLLRSAAAPVEQVAAQLMHAPPIGDETVAQTLRTAAGRASGQGAPESAARYLRRALEEGCPSVPAGPLLAELGAAEAAAAMPEASGHLTAALDHPIDPELRIATQRSLARVLWADGSGESAAELLEQAIDEAAAGPAPVPAGLIADYLRTSTFHPQWRQRSIKQATPLLRTPPEGTDPESRMLLATMAMRSGQDGNPVSETVRLADQAWADGALLGDDAGSDGPGWLMVTWAYELAEEHSRTLLVTSRALAAARQSGAVNAFISASYFHGWASYATGRLGDAQADAEQALAAGPHESNAYLLAALALRAKALVERGAVAEAAAEAARAAELAATTGVAMPWALHAEGRVAFAGNRAAEALDRFERAGAYLLEHLGARHSVLPWRVDAARAARAVGDAARARDLARQELAAAEAAQANESLGRATGVLGLIAGGEKGLELLTRGADLLARTGARLHYAYALADLGAALRRDGRPTAARERLLPALELADRLGADLLGDRIRDELALAGVRAPRNTPGTAGALTPGQLRVAELASQGLTNAEIAQALFVTPKTVEFHLRHVYQRLQVSGRRQLAAALRSSRR
jgi:DNA-binding CsgD family transcriptional regulator